MLPKQCEPRERRLPGTPHCDHMLILAHHNTSHWCFLPPTYLLTTSCHSKIVEHTPFNNSHNFFQSFGCYLSLCSFNFAFSPLFFSSFFPPESVKCEYLTFWGLLFSIHSFFCYHLVLLSWSALFTELYPVYLDFWQISALELPDLDFPIRLYLGWVEILLLLLLCIGLWRELAEQGEA